MEPFNTLEAIACPLGLANIDTDQLIPARFMSRSRAQGYGGYLLHDARFDADGTPRSEFILNHPRYAGMKVLVARRNFGTGSSREAAVYALWDFGIRCVIAPSFGDIFAANAVKNGLLPAVVSEQDLEILLASLSSAETKSLRIDLTSQTIDGHIPFAIDPVRRLQLLNGWDDLDLTLRHREDIAAYRARLAVDRAWHFPSPG
jgi:3-isopropylmalate/(R)-2-methylmalate dehydratase small subunit